MHWFKVERNFFIVHNAKFSFILVSRVKYVTLVSGVKYATLGNGLKNFISTIRVEISTLKIIFFIKKFTLKREKKSSHFQRELFIPLNCKVCDAFIAILNYLLEIICYDGCSSRMFCPVHLLISSESKTIFIGVKQYSVNNCSGWNRTSIVHYKETWHSWLYIFHISCTKDKNPNNFIRPSVGFKDIIFNVNNILKLIVSQYKLNFSPPVRWFMHMNLH